MFQQARKLSRKPFLVVCLARDVNIKKIKGQKPKFSEKKRVALIKGCKLIDKVVLGSKTNFLTRITEEKPEIIALGYDQKISCRKLKNNLKNKGFLAKIVRLKPYKINIYKNHLLKNKKKI